MAYLLTTPSALWHFFVLNSSNNSSFFKEGVRTGAADLTLKFTSPIASFLARVVMEFVRDMMSSIKIGKPDTSKIVSGIVYNQFAQQAVQTIPSPESITNAAAQLVRKVGDASVESFHFDNLTKMCVLNLSDGSKAYLDASQGQVRLVVVPKGTDKCILYESAGKTLSFWQIKMEGRPIPIEIGRAHV